METLLGLILAAALAAGGWTLWRRQRRRRAALALEAKKQLLLQDRRRVLDLQLGDVVEHMGETFLVEGILLYDEEGSVWRTYLLGGGESGGDRWLAVSDDDRLELGFYEVLAAGSIPVPDEPPAEWTVGEVRFALRESGTARVRKRDAMGTRDMGRCEYADYSGPDRALLALERWAENAEIAVGRRVHEDDLIIYPGS